jgi:hypothetical protein
MDVPDSFSITSRNLLYRRLRDLRRELQGLRVAIEQSNLPEELLPYRKKLFDYADDCDARLGRIQRDLESGVASILEDLRSETAQATERVRLLSRRLAAPILTTLPPDRLSLHVIQWMHDTDNQTRTIPAGCSDGDPQVWPWLLFAPLYNFPSLIRRGLLYLPLFFHEYGHVLFFLHKPEMLALVEELQQTIEAELEPLSDRNDEHSRRQRDLQRDVVETWYSWTPELFCDAIGLVMTGPAYLHAFANYLSRLERSDLSRPQQYLAHSSHPVFGLRIKLLTSRARRLGYVAEADAHERGAQTLANILQVEEDYFGFFESAWQPKVESIIDDMLTETAPRQCTEIEAKGDATHWLPGDSPVLLLNAAWKKFLGAPDAYPGWEGDILKIFM